MTQSGTPNDQIRGTASRREREKAQRRDDILRAAREVFFQHGFHTATVDDVAVAAEVSKGTVYLYFDTKETILAHLLLEGLDMLIADLEAAIQKARGLAEAEDLIVITGSLFTIGEAREYVVQE